jgi:hypothetical protein
LTISATRSKSGRRHCHGGEAERSPHALGMVHRANRVSTPACNSASMRRINSCSPQPSRAATSAEGSLAHAKAAPQRVHDAPIELIHSEPSAGAAA